MWLELGRRILMIALIVAVATGFAMPAAQAGSHHAQAVAGVAMSADNLAGCTHDGCPVDQHAAMHATCFTACAGVSILSPPAAIVYFSVARDVLTPSLDRAMVDRTVPPDPHPPKQI
jgi:hypothetical protein